MNLKDVYAVVNYTEEPDRRSGIGGVMTRITLVCLDTFASYDTYVCPGHRNAKHWQTVLSKRGQGLIVNNITRVKQGNRELVNADSKPEIVWEGTLQGLENRLIKLQTPNKFLDLFE